MQTFASLLFNPRWLPTATASQYARQDWWIFGDWVVCEDKTHCSHCLENNKSKTSQANNRKVGGAVEEWTLTRANPRWLPTVMSSKYARHGWWIFGSTKKWRKWTLFTLLREWLITLNLKLLTFGLAFLMSWLARKPSICDIKKRYVTKSILFLQTEVCYIANILSSKKRYVTFTSLLFLTTEVCYINNDCLSVCICLSFSRECVGGWGGGGVEGELELQRIQCRGVFILSISPLFLLFGC